VKKHACLRVTVTDDDVWPRSLTPHLTLTMSSLLSLVSQLYDANTFGQKGVEVEGQERIQLHHGMLCAHNQSASEINYARFQLPAENN